MDKEYKLGQLDASMTEIRERLERIENKLEDLSAWRFKTVGVVSFLVVFLNIGFTLLVKFMDK